MKSAAELRGAAQRYRQLAMTFIDRQTVEALLELAAEYEALADKLDDAAASRQVDPSREP